MNINLNLFYSYSAPLFKEKAFLTSNFLNSRKERILAVVLLALGLLTAAYYVVKHCYFSAKIQKNPNPQIFLTKRKEDKLENQNQQMDATEKNSEILIEEEVKDGQFNDQDDELGENSEFNNQVMVDIDGKIYEKVFKKEKLNGIGEITYPNGDTYTGKFENDELKEGKIIYANKDTYVGTFERGKLKDQGRIIWANGDIYEGIFIGGKLNGQGKIAYFMGETLIGEFKEGKLSQGRITYLTGASVEGCFKNGLLNGQGKITTMDGEISEGQFINGYLNQGTVTYLNGDIAEGTFKCYLLSKGKFTYSNKKILKGTFEYGSLIQGTITYPNGVVIEGSFEEGLLNGKGKLILPKKKVVLSDEVIYEHDGRDKAIVEGDFKDGKLNDRA